MAEKRQEVPDSYVNVKDLQDAIKFIETKLKIVKEKGDTAIEAKAYCHLGTAYHSLGDFRKP